MKYYCDGGGWNGEHSRYAVCDTKGKLVLYAKVFGHEAVTNNVAEYLAVLNAMIIAKQNDEIISDSQVVIYQLTGKYTCKAEHLRPLHQQGLTLAKMKRLKLTWVPRGENLAGHYLDGHSKNNKVV